MCFFVHLPIPGNFYLAAHKRTPESCHGLFPDPFSCARKRKVETNSFDRDPATRFAIDRLADFQLWQSDSTVLLRTDHWAGRMRQNLNSTVGYSCHHYTDGVNE